MFYAGSARWQAERQEAVSEQGDDVIRCFVLFLVLCYHHGQVGAEICKGKPLNITYVCGLTCGYALLAKGVFPFDTWVL